MQSALRFGRDRLGRDRLGLLHIGLRRIGLRRIGPTLAIALLSTACGEQRSAPAPGPAGPTPTVRESPPPAVSGAPRPADPLIDYSEVAGKVSFLTTTAQELREAKANIDPFLSSALPSPPKSVYDGPLFELRRDYPKVLPAAVAFPWQAVTGKGPITQQNAARYVEALKQYVGPDMRRLIDDYASWRPQQEPWWESIWIGTEREPIRGFYVGSGFPAGTLTDQTFDLTTYVLTLYDARAAKTLGDIWGTTLDTAKRPTITPATTQYAEGSVIVKFAFVTPCGADWSPMEGAATWQIYAPLNSSNGSGSSPSRSRCPMNGSDATPTEPALTNVYLMQFDMIVKDTVAAPKTGWVFSTLVYDKDAPGADAWDKMVPLGATWGGNPDVVNTDASALTPPVTVNPALTENWINLDTPAYARSTLGWDGRLSGPNDGAVVTPAWAGSHYFPAGLASAGCFGCHGSAQYPMTSFLLPSSSLPPQSTAPPLSSNSGAASLVLPVPGSPEWMRWFQSRSGTTPQGPATSDGGEPVALDYDMVTAFKAIPMWQAAMAAEAR